MYTITSPVEGITEVSYFGPTALHFEDSVAHVDELGDGLRQYLEGTGYTITEGDPEQPEGDRFDPSAHSVEDVLAYLTGLKPAEGEPEDAALAEVARVIEAEKAGKNRTTLLKAAAEQQANEGGQS